MLKSLQKHRNIYLIIRLRKRALPYAAQANTCTLTVPFINTIIISSC